MDVSFLSTILNQRSDLPAVSRDVSGELQRLKESLHKVIEEKRINLKPLVVKHEQLLKKTVLLGDRAKKSEELNAELKQDLAECDDNISKLSVKLAEGQLTLRIVNVIVEIHNCLDQLKHCLEQRLFFECSGYLTQAETIVQGCQDLKELRIFTQLSREVITYRENLLLRLTQLWSEEVNFQINKGADETGIVISMETKLANEIEQIIKALFHLNDSTILQRFFQKLQETVLLPLIVHDSLVSVEVTSEVCNLNVKIYEKKGAPHYCQVFDRMIIVIEFFNTYMNVEIPSNGTFLEAMGNSIAKEITTNLIKHSLSEAIPSQPGQLESFGEIVANAEKFQTTLQTLGFLPANCSSLMDDTNGANVLFADKMYLSYLDRARAIMQKDLHTAKKSDEILAPGWMAFPPAVASAIQDRFNISGQQPKLMEPLQISKSAQDLLDLADAILKELKKSDESRSVRLLYTVRNIFEMYCAIVPLIHRKMLETIPQTAALFHNNCLHFAYRLIVLSSECRTFWDPCLREHFHVFLDLAAALRKRAADSLQLCVVNQRGQLFSVLYESGLAKLRESQKLDPTTEKSVRQCIRLLQLLRNVWVDVLPEAVFVNAMGFLIDTFTEAVVTLVTETEDISAQATTVLVQVFQIVIDRLPQLFNEPNEVHRLCRKWSRFLELVFVLGNGLDAFCIRWASGKGPLADAFTKSEAQGLVRALFRNTERRAIVLSTIYNS